MNARGVVTVTCVVMLVAIFALDVLTPQRLVAAILLNIPIALSGLAYQRRLTLGLVVSAIVADIIAGVLNARNEAGFDMISLINRALLAASFALVGAMTVMLSQTSSRLEAARVQAQRVRRLIGLDFQEAFKSCDFIMGPVAPTTAWDIGAKNNDPVAMYLEDIYTLGVSLAGLPGMSVPCGFGDGNMPVGLQIIGNYFDEGRMLAAAHQYQQVTDWHTRCPEAFA